MVSQNLGSKNMKRCLKIFAVSSVYVAIWAIVGFLCVRVFFLDEIIGLFNLKNDSLEFVNRFFSEWIPLENLYFSKTNVKERCDLIIKID